MGKDTDPYVLVKTKTHWIPYVKSRIRTRETVQLHEMFWEVFEIKRGSYLQHALNQHCHDIQA